MPQAVRGVLIESDESVMSFIRTMDEKSKYIIEELDSRHVLVQENKVEEIRAKLEAKLKHTIPDDEDSSSDGGGAPTKKG